MKKIILLSSVALVVGSVVTAQADPKSDVLAAAKKLADQGNYSWKSTMDLGANSPFQPGPTEGKTDKDGTTWLSVTFGDNAMEGVLKGTNVVVKTEEGWKSGAESTGGGGGGGGMNFGNFMARQMQNLKAPATEVQDLVAKTKDIKMDGDAYTGELTDEGAKDLSTMGFGRRRGQGGQGGPPEPTGVKGSVKFWIKDGAVVKYVSKVSGKRKDQDGNDAEFQRDTTVEIKDVGTTKLTIPDDAKKKLS